jgi:predicted signal transduction protein with EAL and GGDEF domain
MTDPKSARTTLARLRGMGTRISIDDFGTGYSSLAYLRDLPADEVKIDRSFVKEMGSREQDACIVRSIIELGHNLGLRVVAEGVEDRTTADRLAEMGCDHAQGFYLTRPLPPGDFAAWLAANRQIPLPRENAVRGPRMMAIRDSENLLNASGSPNLTASPTSTAASIRDWSTTRSSRTMSSKSADA